MSNGVLNRIRKTIRKARQILAGYDAALARISTLESELRKRTTVACDIGFRSHANYAIMIGSLNGKDYVESFAVEGGSFPALIHQLKEMSRFAAVTRIDCPPQFCAVLDREVR